VVARIGGAAAVICTFMVVITRSEGGGDKGCIKARGYLKARHDH
jgi:hypothetical protein